LTPQIQAFAYRGGNERAEYRATLALFAAHTVQNRGTPVI
jgi:hypothetical protein